MPSSSVASRRAASAGVDVAAGLHPAAEALVQVQHSAAAPDHNARRRDMGGIGVLVVRIAQALELAEEARLGRLLAFGGGRMGEDEGLQVHRGDTHGGQN